MAAVVTRHRIVIIPHGLQRDGMDVVVYDVIARAVTVFRAITGAPLPIDGGRLAAGA